MSKLLSLKEFIYEKELYEYNKAIGLLESYSNNTLEEGILDHLPSSLKQKFEFLKALADESKSKIEDIVELFKNSKVFEFFKEIKFNLQNLFNLLKKGHDTYVLIQVTIAKWVHDNKVGKWTTEKLKELDAFLQTHPKIKQLGGILVGGLVLYIYFAGTSTGDAGDFDLSSMIDALHGHYSLADLFGGPEGTKTLLLFALGTVTGGFPWATAPRLAAALIIGLKKSIHGRRRHKKY